MSALRDISSNHGTDAIALLPHEDLRSTGLNIHILLTVEVKLLQFYLKHLQEEGIHSIDDSFDYSSIDESILRRLVNHPTIIG